VIERKTVTLNILLSKTGEIIWFWCRFLVKDTLPNTALLSLKRTISSYWLLTRKKLFVWQLCRY